MEPRCLYCQQQVQLRQWVRPYDQPHLQSFAEIVVAILHPRASAWGSGLPI